MYNSINMIPLKFVLPLILFTISIYQITVGILICILNIDKTIAILFIIQGLVHGYLCGIYLPHNYKSIRMLIVQIIICAIYINTSNVIMMKSINNEETYNIPKFISQLQLFVCLLSLLISVSWIILIIGGIGFLLNNSVKRIPQYHEDCTEVLLN